MKWISIRDELPEFNKLVMITNNNGLCGTMELEKSNLDIKKLKKYLLKNKCVTHWMPLPELPKE